MSIDNILKLLNEKINRERLEKERVIIFWVDTENSYKDMVQGINIPDYNIVTHTTHNQFALKKLIELDKPNENFIIYRNEEIPENENWLIDIEKYSEYFSPDEISMLIDELEVPKSLQNNFRKYKYFFRASKRVEQFKVLYNKTLNEKELMSCLYAVVLGIRSKVHQDIMKTFIMESLKGINLLKDLEKYDLRVSFENFIKDE
ncbi:MAG: hypothetical protein KBF12_14505, partial [Sebaldella sp.]|nr:hypothetical protein [Sebaldella sp.]